MPEVAQATITVTPVMAGAQEKITNDLTQAAGPAGSAAGAAAGSKMSESMGKSMSSAGAALTKGVTAPIMGIGAAAVASWKSVDEGLDTIVQKTGASGSALEEMEGILRDITTTIPTDFATAGAAIGEVNTRFGLTGKGLEDLSGQFVKFAQLNNQDVSGSVDSVSKMMAGFGLSADQAGKMLDALNTVGQQTGVDVGTLADQVASNAKQFQEMGLSAEEAASFLGSASMAGLDTSTAMMGLKTAMKNATEDGIGLDEALKNFDKTMQGNGSQSEKLTAAYELFGSRAGGAIANAVENGTLSLSDFTTSLGDFEGSVSSTFEETKDPMDDFTTTLNDLKLLGADIVDSAGPMIVDIMEDLAEGVSQAADAWNGLSPEMQETIVKGAGILAVAGPLLSIGGSLVGVIGSIGSGLISVISGLAGTAGAAAASSGPVAASAASFQSLAGSALQMIAAGAAFFLVAEGFSLLADAAIRVADAGGPAIAVLAGMAVGIGALMFVASAVGPALTAGAVGIVAFGVSLLAIGAGVALACAGITLVIDAIGGLVEVISSNSEEINSIVTNVGETVGGVVTTISDGIATVIDAVSGGISGVLDSVAGIFESMGGAALDAGTGFEKLAGAVLNLTKNTGVLDLAGTMAAVATGVGKVNKAATDAGAAATSINALSKGLMTIGTSAAVSSKGMVTFGTASSKSVAQVGASFSKLNFSKDMTREMTKTIASARSGINTLKGMFSSTHFSFNQHIAVPHFSMSGSFNAQTGSTPTVSTKWYKVAESSPYIFHGATLFGGGEHSDEILYGREALLNDIREASGGRPITNNFYIYGNENPEHFAHEVARQLRMEMRMA